jgi:hypothetical protein
MMIRCVPGVMFAMGVSGSSDAAAGAVVVDGVLIDQICASSIRRTN